MPVVKFYERYSQLGRTFCGSKGSILLVVSGTYSHLSTSDNTVLKKLANLHYESV